MSDFEKIARAWHLIRAHDRVNLTLETATMLFRYANYGICTSRDPQPPDPRQYYPEVPPVQFATARDRRRAKFEHSEPAALAYDAGELSAGTGLAPENFRLASHCASGAGPAARSISGLRRRSRASIA